jgi:hypothetical protein
MLPSAMSEYLYLVAPAAILCIVALAYYGLRTRFRLRGYGDSAEEIRALAVILGGSIARDKNDLEIKGAFGGRKLRVRFSNQENTPGCLIEMPGKNQLSFYTLHEQAPAGVHVGRFVRSGKQMVYARELTGVQQFLASNGEQLLPRVLLSREWSLRVEPSRTLLLMQAIPRDLTQMFRVLFPPLLSIVQLVAARQEPFFTRQRTMALALVASVAAVAFLLWRLV